MAHLTADRVLQVVTPVATTSFTLGAAVVGFRGVAAIPGIVTNDTIKYSAWGVDANGTPTGDWENGVGTYNSTTGTLARTTIVSSSNANAAVTFTATTVYLANSLIASHTVVEDDAGKVTLEAATTTRAPLNLPQGTAPTAPANGDIWTTAAGFFARIGGVTVRMHPTIGPPTLGNATTTTETIIARWAIPANMVAAGDALNCRALFQAGGTATVAFRLRIGAAGTTADAVAATLTTSAAQVANAQITADFTAYFPSTTQARATGFAIAQAAVLGTPTAANTTLTVSTTATLFVSITATLSAANTTTTLGAYASFGD